MRAEAEIVAADAADHRPQQRHEAEIFRAAMPRLLAVGHYRDELGVRWTLEGLRVPTPSAD